MPEPQTATRERIVRVAAGLISEQGAGGTTLDDVSTATGASVGQLREHFGSQRGLVEAVVRYQCAAALDRQIHTLQQVRSWEDLERWAELMVEEHGPRGGCPIGTLAAELADTDEELRVMLSHAFRSWSGAIREALSRLRAGGLISADANLDALTTMMLAAIQGGLLLTKTSRDVRHLRTALAGAIAEARAHAPARVPRRRSSPR